MINRRTGLKITGAALLSGAVFGFEGCATPPRKPILHVWEANALGAPGSIKIAGGSAQHAQRTFELAQKEIKRLEHIFSLYQPSSEISRLNKNGVLNNPSVEMFDILNTAQHISKLTQGAFDISVQPLWVLSEKLKYMRVTQDGLATLWKQARARVNYKNITIEKQKISFAKPNMSITLNALAQGYITDKISELIIAEGHKNALVNIGEHRAFGRNGNQEWRVGIQDPRNVMDTLEIIPLRNAALATSSALGGQIRKHIYHIFNPKNTGTTPSFISASVVHARADIADALATAFTLMDINAITKTAKLADTMQVILVDSKGAIIKI